jgi:hypothetical protein
LDPFVDDESPLLRDIGAASVLGCAATGPRAGRPIVRLGRDQNAPWVESSGARHAHVDGFDLHANVAVPAGDRERLEHLCRYVLRPPVAQDALELKAEGKILLRIRRPWRDGTRAILFTPSELLEKLVSIIPRPRVNLLIYHGALGPSARLRRVAVSAASSFTRDALPFSGEGRVPDAPAGGHAGMSAPAAAGPAAAPSSQAPKALPGGSALEPPQGGTVVPNEGSKRSRPRRRYFAWADLLRRCFQIDVLACPTCGGRLRLLATIEDPAIVRRILAHLGPPTQPPVRLPPRSPPWSPAGEVSALDPEPDLAVALARVDPS